MKPIRLTLLFLVSYSMMTGMFSCKYNPDCPEKPKYNIPDSDKNMVPASIKLDTLVYCSNKFDTLTLISGGHGIVYIPYSIPYKSYDPDCGSFESYDLCCSAMHRIILPTSFFDF